MSGSGRIRRALIWLAPLPLAAAPILTVALTEQSGQPHRIATIILAPGIAMLYLAALADLAHPAVLLAGAGLFWYLLAVLFLNSLLGHPNRFTRILFILFCAAAIIFISMAWGTRRWAEG
jgi:hypothetical protein